MYRVAAIADDVPSLEHAVFFWTDEWNHLIEGDEMVHDDELAQRRAELHPDDAARLGLDVVRNLVLG